MRQTRTTTPAVPAASAAPAPTSTPAARAAVKPATLKAAMAALARKQAIKKAIKPPSIKSTLAAPSNPLMAQFVRDMQVAGHGEGTQHAYLDAIQRFIQSTWVAPAAATEADFQSWLIALRRRDVAGQTFRVQRFALQFLFQNTLAREWAIFKKN